MTDRRIPTLPPLYLEENKANFPNFNKPATTNPDDDNQSSFDMLPSEIVMKCVAEYADWGDLAKLSCVQSSWKGLVHGAADHCGIESRWQLAEALLDGTNGLERNPKLSIAYFNELAGGQPELRTEVQNANKVEEFSFTPAMRRLANCYLTGTGVDRNEEKGITWLEKAATEGDDMEAAHELAVIYELGEHGVAVDVVAAARWFLHGAERGLPESMAEYAMCCELGCGREQDDEEAIEWYIKAARAGHTEANFSVGEAFEEARGVPQSDEEACLWYYKAAVVGDEDSKRALGRLSDIARIVLPGWRTVLHA